MNSIFKTMVIAAGMMTLVLPDTAAAYYSPALGRFMQRDPADYVDGLNLYQFLRGAPIRLLDPFGLNGYGSSAYFGQIEAIRQAVANGSMSPAMAEAMIRDLQRRRGEMWEKIRRVGGNAIAQCQAVNDYFNPQPPLAGVPDFDPVLGLLKVAGWGWNSPNTLLGLGFGVFGGRGIGWGNNAFQFIDHPLMPTAITLGNAISYGPGYYPGAGPHERQHTYQGMILGPFYLPAHTVGGIMGTLSTGGQGGAIGAWHGPGNFMEGNQPWPGW